MSGTRWVYSFGGGAADGEASMKNLLGGKGANLAEMSTLGLPVPPGFTVTTEACNAFYAGGRQFPDELAAQVEAALARVEAIVGKRFGDVERPLLVSVRSGARASMPGMMDTVLNLGLNDATVEGLAAQSGDARFAWDSYRRFIHMYASVVLGVAHHNFEEILDDAKETKGVDLDTDLDADDWRALVVRYKAAITKAHGREFPQDPQAQLWGAIGAVFNSWMNKRAIDYRRLYDIPESWGTAVNVQAMVFGNMGQASATGVAFTRDPSTGERTFYGEYLQNAQGEDVVAGIRTPNPLTVRAKQALGSKAAALEEAMPEVFAQLDAAAQRLEAHYRDMQDIEFTVERGVLYMLQTRNAKRTAKAAVRIAVDLVAEGKISESEAVLRVDPNALDQLLHPTIDPAWRRDVIATGLAASPGAASGAIVFDADEAEILARAKQDVILVRRETSPEDIHGMHAARAVVTSTGGMTSHAAVVARGMGRPCVCGATDLRVDAASQTFTVRGRTFKRGDVITVDGTTGQIMAGEAQMIQPDLSGDFSKLMSWADNVRRLKVRANAETPLDARAAREFGAEGIGLCRTEHMFFDAGRIAAVREMILSDRKEGRVAALERIAPMQRQDFVDLFSIMGEHPVTIRLLDPPLHEFLPKRVEDVEAIAVATGVDARTLLARAEDLHETNPMLGHRGCRLGITYPEIYEMQARAIFEAASLIAKETGKAPQPEIMIPLVATRREIEILKACIDEVALAVAGQTGVTIAYSVGTMIELPRAAICADEIALSAEFFSFGTNDLTQTTIGISRDDAGRFMNAYVTSGIFEKDPFVSIDVAGVGALVRLGVQKGRGARPDIKLGVCGEHGGDPASIDFFESVGLDYISCSPYRVPIARLAAAQAALRRA